MCIALYVDEQEEIDNFCRITSNFYFLTFKRDNKPIKSFPISP